MIITYLGGLSEDEEVKFTFLVQNWDSPSCAAGDYDKVLLTF